MDKSVEQLQAEVAGLRSDLDDLLTALVTVTNHFAAVMNGPFLAGVTFQNGVEGIPTIARARAAIRRARQSMETGQ